MARADIPEVYVVNAPNQDPTSSTTQTGTAPSQFHIDQDL
jgi:hypothetical protein